MKKSCVSLCIILLTAISFTFSACTDATAIFKETEDGILNTDSQTEYEFLAFEGHLCYFGELTFQGSVKGEKKISSHLSYFYQTGLYSIEHDETQNILVRKEPDSEWCRIYRKASLPEFDFSVDNCIRLELVSGGLYPRDVIHVTCGDGITDKAEIAEFLSVIRSQEANTHELFKLVEEPNGMLRNCYEYSAVYGFFEAEPNLAVRMSITSYDDLAYSISIEGNDYILPEEWLERLQNK